MSGLRPTLQTVVKGLQKVLRKSWWMRMSRFESIPLRMGELIIAKAHKVHHNACGSKCGDGVQMHGNSRRRVQRDRKPDSLDSSFRNAVAPQEIARGIGAIHLEAQPAFSKAGGQADIMEHGCGVEKFRIEAQTLTLSSQGAPK